MHTTRKKKKEHATLIIHSQQQPDLKLQQSGQQTRFSKSDASKKGAVHNHRCHPIKYCWFSPGRKSELFKQSLQQGNCHYHIQPMKARPRVFSLDTETWQLKCTTKVEEYAHIDSFYRRDDVTTEVTNNNTSHQGYSYTTYKYSQRAQQRCVGTMVSPCMPSTLGVNDNNIISILQISVQIHFVPLPCL